MVVVKPGRWRRPGDSDHIVNPGGIGNDPDFQPPLVPCPAIALPILQFGPHIGDRCHAIGQQHVLRLAQCQITLRRFGGRNRILEQADGGIDKDTRRLAGRFDDGSAARRF